MWTLFFACWALCAILLICPGVAFLKAIKAEWSDSIVFSPLISVALLEIFAILFSAIGLHFALVPALASIALLVGIVFLMTSLFSKRCGLAPSLLCGSTAENLKMLIAYIAVAMVAALFFYVLPLDGANSFNQDHDNVLHLNLIQAFAQSGDMSALGTSVYKTASVSPYLSNSSFYPAAWHMIAAIAAMGTGAEPSIAANAMNTAILTLVIPLSFFALMRSVCGGNKTPIYIGALLSVSFCAFPWAFYTFGPLYPNVFGMSSCPCFVAFFVLAFKENAFFLRKRKLFFAIVFFLSFISLTFAHTNALFSSAVILIPYIGYLLYDSNAACFGGVLRSRNARIFAFCIVVSAAWVLAYKIPFLNAIASFDWPATVDVPNAVFQILAGSYNGVAQSMLALLVLVGIFFALRVRDLRWLVCSWLLAALLLVVASGVDGLLIKHLLTGFWYTDPYRLAATLVVCAVPLSSFGLAFLVNAFAGKAGKKAHAHLALSVLLVALVVAIIYVPINTLRGEARPDSAFGQIQQKLTKLNKSDIPNIVAPEERVFMKKVKDTVGDSLVLNCPEDGSFFAYGLTGLNVYYRSTGLTSDASQTDESYLVKNYLFDIAYSQKVKQAIRSLNAEYVLVLDQGGAITADRHTYGYYEPFEWNGINKIRDDTPGFEVVLSEGDMRLYRIVD